MADLLGPELPRRLRCELEEERLAAQFSAIEQGLAARRRRRRSAAAAALVVLVVLVSALALRGRPSTSEPEPRWRSQVATTEDAPQKLVLSDGSSLVLARATQARLCEAEAGDVCVALDHGAVEFAVSRDPARSFWVEAGEVRVRVVGTRFMVEHEPGPNAGGRVAVSVHEGVVEVDVGDGEARRLAAGERWERRLEAPPATLAAKPPPALAPKPHAPAPASSSPARAPPPPARVPEQPAPERPTAEPPAPEPSAAELLWAEARAARREGASADEAAAYAELLRRQPRDPSTGLAAFELGRLRMDELGDLGGAIQALERAIALGGASSPYHEDSLARLVRAHARRGAQAKCRAARAEYLSAYPEGVHVAMVQSQCPP